MIIRQELWDLIHSPPVPTTMSMGMNLPDQSYYSPIVYYNDLQNTAALLFTSYGDFGPWNSEMISEIEVDSDGYPTYLPQLTSDGNETFIKYLITRKVTGRHNIYYDGTGTFSGSLVEEDVDGSYYVECQLDTDNWIEIKTSDINDPVKNIRIVPEIYSEIDTVPLFRSDILTELAKYSTLRFMDFGRTNNNKLTTRRVLPTDIVRSDSDYGGCYEHMIDLANTLQKDVWLCIPHMASDAYITETAQLFKDTLDSNLKVYLEYSNEMWNWMFAQAGWVLNNATNPPAIDTYVSTDLANIDDAGSGHPEKDAYMMARTFRLWDAVYGSEMSSRVVRTGAVQGGWVSNSVRIMDYLFDVDGNGCDSMATTAYFSHDETVHNKWLTEYAEGTLTYEGMYNDTLPFTEDTYDLTRNQTLADERGVDHIIYEAGQHMQPFGQTDWDTNQMLWDFQLQPQMYDLYEKNLQKLTTDTVNTKLYMAFTFMGTRESKYGSWGHLESMDQLGLIDYTTVAPKYQALLDYNNN